MRLSGANHKRSPYIRCASASRNTFQAARIPIRLFLPRLQASWVLGTIGIVNLNVFRPDKELSGRHGSLSSYQIRFDPSEGGVDRLDQFLGGGIAADGHFLMLDASEIGFNVIQFRAVGRQEVQLNPLVSQLRQGLLHCLRAVAGSIVQHHHSGLALPPGQAIEQKIAHICTFPGACGRPPGQGLRRGGAGGRQRGYHIHASALRVFVGDVGAVSGSAPGIGGGQRGRESAFVQVKELEMAVTGLFLSSCNSARAAATRSGSCLCRRQDLVRW